MDIKDNSFVDIQDCDDSRSGSVSPAPTESSNTSHSEGEANVSRKRAKSTKILITSMKNVSKNITQEGKQDILRQHSKMCKWCK